MRVSDLAPAELDARLRRGRLALGVSPFAVTLKTAIPLVSRNLQLLYGDYPLLDADRATDFQIELTRGMGLRRFIRPQTNFSFDGHFPFKPLPREQAFALFEWGVNWAISTGAHQFLILHAAVVARDNLAIILPGDPGAGKSTLCAALVSRGWRLLSDEMTLLDPDTLAVTPVPRPVSLKNASIDIIRQFAPGSVFGDVATDTAKGTVSHLKPPRASVEQASVTATPVAVLFPRYQANADLDLGSKPKSETLMGLAQNCFNYQIHGTGGFEALRRLTDRASCADLRYSRLEDAIREFDTLLD